MDWNVANAKSQLSELINSASDEPQIIYNRKKPTAVVLNYEEFNRLKNLDVLVHKVSKWAKFIEYSENFTQKNSITFELPSRADRVGLLN